MNWLDENPDNIRKTAKILCQSECEKESKKKIKKKEYQKRPRKQNISRTNQPCTITKPNNPTGLAIIWI